MPDFNEFVAQLQREVIYLQQEVADLRQRLHELTLSARPAKSSLPSARWVEAIQEFRLTPRTDLAQPADGIPVIDGNTPADEAALAEAHREWLIQHGVEGQDDPTFNAGSES